MRMKAEAETDILRNLQGESEHLAMKDFKAKFCKLIIFFVRFIVSIYTQHI